MDYSSLIKFTKHTNNRLSGFTSSEGRRVTHTLKFATLYLPASIKNVRLILREGSGRNRFLSNNDSDKVMVKQSYIILAWVSYLGSVKLSRKDSGESETPLPVDKVVDGDAIPGFFIYPTSNYKTTTIKAPMAHKTFSQEQFMLRYYFLSITFNLQLGDNECVSVNQALYYSGFVIRSVPVISTNLLFLKRYTVSFCYLDRTFFSYFVFNSL